MSYASIDLQLDKRASLADVRCFVTAYRAIDNFYSGSVIPIMAPSVPTFEVRLAKHGTWVRMKQLSLLRSYRKLFVRATLYNHGHKIELNIDRFLSEVSE